MATPQTFRRTYHKGRMNLDDDNRLLPPGEYREATNILVNNSEGSNEGAVRKTLSNKRLTNLNFGANPVTILEYAYDKRDRIYWGVKSDNGCFLVEYDNTTQSATFVLHDTRPLGQRVFDLRETHLCTAVSIVTSDEEDNELLLMSDDNMQPLCINISRAKTYGENGFEKEDIYLIKKPPRFAPTAQLTYAGGLENDMEEEFFSFFYRYKYLDGEYSALSDPTNYQFSPGPFQLDYQSGEQLGMVNQFNAVRLGFNTGDKRVTDVQLVFKKSNSNNLYIIETFNKEMEGWDNEAFQYFTFTNNKLYQALPLKELYRTFDNVPLKAKAMALLGNKPFFGNYLEGYNMTDVSGRKVKPEYAVSLMSKPLSGEFVPVLLPASGDTDGNSTLRIDLSGIDLKEGGRLSFYFDMKAVDDTSLVSGSFEGTYQYILLHDYDNASSLAADEGFIHFITSIISANFNSGFVLTPPTDGELTNTTSFSLVSTTTTIDIIGPQQTYTIDETPENPDDNPANTHAEIYEWRFFGNSTVNYRSFGVASSVKTNRSYEVGIVYEDEFNRCSTVQTSINNTLYIPQTLSTQSNKLKITLDSLPPTFADRFKPVVKQQTLSYYNIYCVLFYEEGLFRWIKLDGENKDKVKEGDTLILKADFDGPRYDIKKVKVLEAKEQERNFITVDAPEGQTEEQAGFYIKIKGEGISININDNSFFSYSGTTSQIESTAGVSLGQAGSGGSAAPDFNDGTFLGYFDTTTSLYVDLPVTAGSQINISFLYSSIHADQQSYQFTQQYIASADYSNFKDWFLAEVELPDDQYTVNFVRNADNSLYFQIEATNGLFGTMAALISLQLSSGLVIFETEPKQADVEIYYETGQTFEIKGGYHNGNIQVQNAVQPAIIELDFFNCYAVGNGAECYQVKDSIRKSFLNIDLRPSTTSIEEYKQVRRTADITYGEAYVESAGINGLNVFNLSTANYKDDIDKQYGSIQKLHARENNLVVLQEEKAGQVLYDKNALYTADGDNAITSVPGVLGQYLPFQGNRGIGTHPESFSVDPDGRIKYDSRRNGTIVRLSNDGVEDINYGLKNFFKSLFISQPNAKLISGYDPYHDVTVFSIGNEPERLPQFNCSALINKYQQEDVFSYELVLNNLGGDIVFTYNITSGNATISAEFNENTTVASNVTGIGSVTIPRDSLVENIVTITITPISESVNYTILNTCPIGTELTVVSVVLNDGVDTGSTMTDRYKWTGSPFFTTSELFLDAPVTRFETQTGIEGTGAFPANNATVTMQAFKDTINNGHFATSECNRLGYLITDEIYTSADHQEIIDNPDTEWLTISTSGEEGFSETNAGSFIFGRSNVNERLYMIWDYTSRNPVLANDSANVTLGNSVIIDVLENDTVTDGFVSIATQPSHGTAVANVDGTITYTHDGTNNFTDSFTYSVTEGNCASTATVNITIGISCGDSLNASGNQGIYEVTVNLGTDTGYAGIAYNAQNIPDRFQIFWNDELVADSKFVGDGFTGNPPTYTGLLGEHTLSVYQYNGSSFVDTGNDETITVTQSDIANGTTEPTDGQGIIYFEKTTALPASVLVRVTGVNASTAWSITNVICPQPEIPT